VAWIDAISWLTAAWLLICGGRAILDLSRGEKHSVLFLILIHLLFCGAPLLLDVTIGRPTYGFFTGFYRASLDPTSAYIYCAYVASVPIVLYIVGRTKRPRSQGTLTAARRLQALDAPTHRLNLVFWLALVAPLLAAVASPQRDYYRTYGTMATESLGDFEQYHAFVATLCLIGIVGGIGVLLTAQSLSKRLFLTLSPWFFSACWLFGKRIIVALLLLGLVYVWWYRGSLKGQRFIVALCIGAVVIAIGSYNYQRIIRQTTAKEFDAYYSGLRIDFCRDAGIRQVIYAELGGDTDRILDYRGQSLLFYAVIYVPRALWSAKPWPYAVYQTSRALELSVVTPIGWAVTTSWLDEAIANCGWFGLLVGPLCLAFLCRIGDRTADSFTRYVTVCIGTLLMAVQLAAFVPLVIIWLALCAWQYHLGRWGLRSKRFQAVPRLASQVCG